MADPLEDAGVLLLLHEVRLQDLGALDLLQQHGLVDQPAVAGDAEVGELHRGAERVQLQDVGAALDSVVLMTASLRWSSIKRTFRSEVRGSLQFGPDYFARVPRYGVGLGINPTDFNTAYLATDEPLVDFLEVTAPSARHRGPLSYGEVQRRVQRDGADGFVRHGIPELSTMARVLVHSTNVNPVYADPPAEQDLAKVRDLLEVSGSPWVTEDLGVWLMSERHVYPHFMPLPLTADTLAVAVDNIRYVQEILGRPFNAEFPPMNYVVGDLNAFEFFARLCEHTGCGMCVDVGHVLSYQIARGASPTADLHRIPWSHVTEIHFAGGGIDLVKEGYLYQDTHGDRDVVSVCFDLMDEVIASAPNLRAVALELFGARQPQRALQRLRATRQRPALAAWLTGEPAAAHLPAVADSRQRVKLLSVAMYDVLHSDTAVTGSRLAEQGPELADVFAAAEQRRWEYDRRSRLLVLGNSIASYCPVTAGWLQRETGWRDEELYSRLIKGIDGTAPLSISSVADAFHALLPDRPGSALLHEVLRCEVWMNECAGDPVVPQKQTFQVDYEQAMNDVADPAASLAAAQRTVSLIHLGNARFARRGTSAPATIADAQQEKPATCGSARCCAGE